MCARTSVQTDLLANGGETTGLAALVHGLGDPVDPGVAADLHQAYMRAMQALWNADDLPPCGWGRRR